MSFEAKKWVNATQDRLLPRDNPLPALVQEVSSFWLESDATKTNIAPLTEQQPPRPSS